ncbi:RluA family pseudouridine synthase [Pontibacillus salipaludis]|uniref:RluA family pseudouridine synthase n=1 Tax=Pontibacillus salipaludis TaxID=1697394 RepID=UPI0031E80A6E
MSLNTHHVTQEEHNERLDKVLTALNEDASRAQVQAWVKDQFVMVNGANQKSNYKCQEGDVLSWDIPEPEPMEVLPEDIPVNVVYEDEDVIVVNKPKGMVVHPSAGHSKGTLVNALLHHCQDLSGINGVMRPGIVHRIDKDTSGLIMVAKNDKAHTSLAEQLSNKTVERKYVALVQGVIHHEYGTIDAPIGRDPKDRQKQGVVEGGKNAVTHFKVLDRFEEHTLVECVLETGRTHQIRVHMNYIEHPIIGDHKYGPRRTLDLNGQALHAKELGFEHPSTGEWLHFDSDLPEELKQVLEHLSL